jgi:acetyltransferase-like isoleucine patch superfamily enzyme
MFDESPEAPMVRASVAVKRLAAWLLARILVMLTRGCDYVHIAEMISLIPFRFGNQVRYQFYRATLEHCGADITINFGSIISSPKTILGSHIWIGTYNIIGEANIQDYTLTAQGCHIVSGATGHAFADCSVPIMYQPYTPVRCSIGPDVWIGANAVLMANVGQGCVVGAGSIVNRDIPDWSVAVGNPARVIRKREVGSSGTETKHTDHLR